MDIQEIYQLFLKSDGISTDTRKIKPNTLFFALKGDHFNGNEFAANAISDGCNYAIVDEAKYAISEKYIVVNNVLKTLQNLANIHRKQFSIPIIGITGSNGKTTTKELMGVALQTSFNVLITEGNLNNHLGVPLTLLNLNLDHEIAIIEMGASKPGDIEELCEIAEPTHGIITNIGAAHIEGFGSIQGVINTKTELYRNLNKNKGTVFCNIADETLKNLLPPDCEKIFYGEGSEAISGKIDSLNPFLNFIWQEPGYQSPTLNTHLVGAYNLTNFLAAISIAKYFGVDVDKINHSLSSYIPANKRSQIEKTKRNTLLVDCYNANATSMAAALENFISIDHPQKIAILGDMLELGNITAIEHQKIVEYLEDKNTTVYLIGKEFLATQTSFQKFETVADFTAQTNLSSLKNKFILLKGSRGIQLEKLIELL